MGLGLWFRLPILSLSEAIESVLYFLFSENSILMRPHYTSRIPRPAKGSNKYSTENKRMLSHVTVFFTMIISGLGIQQIPSSGEGVWVPGKLSCTPYGPKPAGDCGSHRGVCNVALGAARCLQVSRTDRHIGNMDSRVRV